MTGVMAGSTALHYHSRTRDLRVVTITINNRCNLQCPHCYLQYDGPPTEVDETVTTTVLDSPAEHIAIVGKEPFVDARSARITEKLVLGCLQRSKSASVITNGLGLNKLSADACKAIGWIDVSLDGGPKTYSTYRRANLSRVIQNVRASFDKGLCAANALHTLSSENLSKIDDMLDITEGVSWQHILFSPYVRSVNDGYNGASPVDFSTIIEALARSRAFVETKTAFLFVGRGVFDSDEAYDAAVRQVYEGGLVNKTIFVKDDPIDLGYIRVTYDGFALSPSDSLHTRYYKKCGQRITSGNQLQGVFEEMRGKLM